MTVDAPGQHVVERTAVLVHDDAVEARFTVALPAQGRTVLGRAAHGTLVECLPRYVAAALRHEALDAAHVAAHVACVEDSAALRSQLAGAGLVAFVGDGSVLPRRSGASDEPMAEGAVPFASPPSLARTFHLPNRGLVTGMGVPVGVTLVVGGGFHGKSTLLKAVELGVYDHLPGDGRELVVTDAAAVKVRAEDGRAVEGTDISPFISNLPYAKDTRGFRTQDASGSTSQAAAIQEALEAGGTALVVDEDTCATNFMIRDDRMQALVAPEKEPITPLISRIRGLAGAGVSTVLVVGGCGDYFDVADTVVMMDSFVPRDVTREAAGVAARFRTPDQAEALRRNAQTPFPPVPPRVPTAVLDPADPSPRIMVRNKGLVSLGQESGLELDLGCVEQLGEKSQTRAIADALLWFHRNADGRATLSELLDRFDQELDARGLDAIAPAMRFGHYARPRRHEVAAALSRLRTFRVR
mmetsp:Transcript_9383/g.32644  ORF Transcript_9383/g.32644 Transcript_9383/m.32644 type:complete len:469 (+) Transcript_9383:687-2093(+)